MPPDDTWAEPGPTDAPPADAAPTEQPVDPAPEAPAAEEAPAPDPTPAPTEESKPDAPVVEDAPPADPAPTEQPAPDAPPAEGDTAPAPQARPVTPTLKQGDTGAYVRKLQLAIRNKAGGNCAVDGYFGPRTAARVKQLQEVFELEVTGIVDVATWLVVDFLNKQDAQA